MVWNVYETEDNCHESWQTWLAKYNVEPEIFPCVGSSSVYIASYAPTISITISDEGGHNGEMWMWPHIWLVAVLSEPALSHPMCHLHSYMHTLGTRGEPGLYLKSPLTKSIFVTACLSECLGVVRPESQGNLIPELNGQMQWTSGAPGSAGEARGCAGEYLRGTRVCRWQAWEPLKLL